MRDLAHHFEGFLVRFRPGVGIINAVKAGHLGQQLFRKKGTGNGPDGTTKEVHLDDCVAHSIANRFAPVANINRPNTTRNGVNVFDAFLVPDPQALAFNDNFRIGTAEKWLVLYQVMPDVCAVCFDNAADIVFRERSIHVVNLSMSCGHNEQVPFCVSACILAEISCSIIGPDWMSQ